MCLHGGPRLPTAEELVLEDAELRKILTTIAQRSAGGRSVGGRYNKHDTARLRFIRSIALPGIRFGKTVPEDDMAMLRLGPKHSLRGADLAAMDTWSQRHGRDPRSRRKDGWLDESEQVTLFRWLSRNESCFVTSERVRRGLPKAYKLDFGGYAGYTLGQLVAHSSRGGGHLLPASERDETTPPPGPYVLWLASADFEWQLPRHLHLYLALKSNGPLPLAGDVVAVDAPLPTVEEEEQEAQDDEMMDTADTEVVQPRTQRERKRQNSQDKRKRESKASEEEKKARNAKEAKRKRGAYAKNKGQPAA